MVKTDIEIAQDATIDPIVEIASKIGLNENDIELYGKYKAKIAYDAIHKIEGNKDGKLILVTAINPTPAGEGKSTVTIGLGDAFNQLGENAVIALREPSLGPVMGVKGGATGGGYSQVIPMEDINLHFTGDMHAITTANNALSALIDNHLQQGNELNIDSRRIIWKRVVDLNDRALRNVVIGLGGPVQGVPREDGFDITVASEIMAILCLASDLDDLKKRIGNIVIAYNYDREPITVHDLKVEGALALLLKDAIKPNLVQTLEHSPAFVHGGPFANIAHGCNSILATKLALKLGNYAITEAGFGADLGGEKFLDITAPNIGKYPDAIVIVATIRALKMHGGVPKDQLSEKNVEALIQGFSNLEKHIENMKLYNIPVVVAINQFATDTEDELAMLVELCNKLGVEARIANVWEHGGKGGIELAKAVIEATDGHDATVARLYSADMGIEEKVELIVKKIYGGDGIVLSPQAKKQLELFKQYGWDRLPVCMAKTQYSLSDDTSKLGRPEGFVVSIRNFVPKIGAGFIVCLTGDVMTMPGLPKRPAALKMDVDNAGNAYGLF